MKIELTDAQVLRMAKAIDVLAEARKYIADAEWAPALRWSHCEQAKRLADTRMRDIPEVEVILREFRVESKALNERYYAKIIDKLRAIADGVA